MYLVEIKVEINGKITIDLLPKTYVYVNIIYKRNIKMSNKKKALAQIVPTRKVNAFFVYIIYHKVYLIYGCFSIFL